MKILVMSDSHGRDDKMEKIISLHPRCDLYVFLGDGIRDAERVFEKLSLPSFIAAGNCDWSSHGHVAEATLDLDGVKAVCCHGHTFGVKSGLGAYAEHAKQKGASLALFGHTHKQLEINLDGVVMFNPGAVCDGCFGLIYIEKGAVLCSHGNL